MCGAYHFAAKKLQQKNDMLISTVTTHAYLHWCGETNDLE